MRLVSLLFLTKCSATYGLHGVGGGIYGELQPARMAAGGVELAAGLSAPLADPITSALANAPLDDEPVTPKDAEAIAEGESDVKDGRVISAAQLRARFGL